MVNNWRAWAALFALIGLGVAIFLFKPDVGPARDLTRVGDAKRGTYLIRLGGCVTCHTDREHNGALLAGGAPMTTPFGIFYPPNITPDPDTGIGAWTLEMFANAISDGNGPKGNLYPVFPYDNFTLMTDQDVVDLYAGLKTVRPVSHRERDHELTFPMNVRLTVSAWKNLFFNPHRYQNDPTRSDRWNHGAYLANGPGHCVACHSPHNALGAIADSKRFTGNPVEAIGGKAPPLTPLALRADGFSASTLIDALKTGVTPSAGKIGGPMGEVVVDETSHWTDRDLTALAAYLLDEP